MPDILTADFNAGPGAGPPHAPQCSHLSSPVSYAIVVVCRSRRRRRRRDRRRCGVRTTTIFSRTSMFICGRPDRNRAQTSVPFPIRPTPVTYMVPVPTPTPAGPVVPTPVPVSRVYRKQRLQQRTAGSSSGSGIEPMIPGAHACAQAFPLHSHLQPGADNSPLDGYTQLPRWGGVGVCVCVCVHGASQDHALQSLLFSVLRASWAVLLCLRE